MRDLTHEQAFFSRLNDTSRPAPLNTAFARIWLVAATTSRAGADSFTLQIGAAAVPELGSFLLPAGALVGLVMLLTARRSRSPHWRGEVSGGKRLS